MNISDFREEEARENYEKLAKVNYKNKFTQKGSKFMEKLA